MSDIVMLKGQRHVITQCGACSVVHTVPEIVWNTQISEGGFHTCPNGHSRGWAKGTDQIEQDRIRQERDRLKQMIAQKDDEIAEERRRREAVEREVIAAKGQATNLRKRAAHGVCPCCNRSFRQLTLHMKNKHPTFATNGSAHL